MSTLRKPVLTADPVTPELRAQARYCARITLASEAQSRSDAHMQAAERHRGTPAAAENHAFAEAYAGLADALRRTASTVVG